MEGTTDSSTAKKLSKKPKYSRFTQQELPACKLILTPQWIIVIFVAVGIIFIPIGVASLFASERVVEIANRYDDSCVPAPYNKDMVSYIKSGITNKTCIKTLPVVKNMKGPVYIYYQLDNYYQNHRRYVKSRSDKQLRSKKDERDVSECSPEGSVLISGKEQIIVPCGLIAWSLFNDTYKFSLNNRDLDVNKQGIAWESDRTAKFGSDVYPLNFQVGGLVGGAKLDQTIPLSNQLDLIVWMRTAALPTFRKLYGKIQADLQANDMINVVIQNNYNSYSFDGRKTLVLSTTSWIGGKNDFIGIAYIAVGGLSLFLAMIFLVLYIFNPRPLGDPAYLSWNKNNANNASSSGRSIN